VPPRNWRLRIEGILDSVEKIGRYTHGLDASSFARKEMVVDAVLQNFMIIGEATRHVPEDVRVRYPRVPWAEMCGMRSFPVHEYFGASVHSVWETVERDLSPLVPQLHRILDENP